MILRILPVLIVTAAAIFGIWKVAETYENDWRMFQEQMRELPILKPRMKYDV